MAKRVQKKISRTPPRLPSAKRRFKPWFLFLLALPLLIWLIYRSLVQPSDINLVATTSAIPTDCTTWFDGCNSCQVVRGTVTSCTKKACKIDPNKPPKSYCVAYTTATTSPAPSVDSGVSIPVTSMAPAASALPNGCFMTMPPCPEGRRCPQVMQTVCPSPTPMGTPVSSYKGLSSFTAKKPCGVASFLDYTFACDAGQEEVTTTSNSECRPFEGVYKQAVVYCGGKI